MLIVINPPTCNELEAVPLVLTPIFPVKTAPERLLLASNDVCRFVTSLISNPLTVAFVKLTVPENAGDAKFALADKVVDRSVPLSVIDGVVNAPVQLKVPVTDAPVKATRNLSAESIARVIGFAVNVLMVNPVVF